MARATIHPGNCGLMTTVEASMNGNGNVHLNIESECASIRKLAATIPEIEPWGELSFRRGMPVVLEKGIEFCSHTACPVPVGIIKAIEVAAGTALPGTASIEVTND